MTIPTLNTQNYISHSVVTGSPQRKEKEWTAPQDQVSLKGIPELANQPDLTPAPPLGLNLGQAAWSGSPNSGNVFADQRNGTLTMFERMPAPDSERIPSGKQLQDLHIDSAFVDRMNIRFMDGGAPLIAYAQSEMGDRSVRLATAGYSAPPEGSGYGPTEARFFEGMVQASRGDMATLNSPSLPKKQAIDSIDGMTTALTQKYDLPSVYITADKYLEYANEVPTGVDRQRFEQTPKFSLPDAPTYSRFTALLSNGLAITGGRSQAISDFRNQVDAGHKVVVFVNDAMRAPIWENDKQRIGNASAFLAGYLDPTRSDLRAQVPMDKGEVQDFASWLGQRTTTDLVKSRFNPNGQVLFLNASDPDASQKAFDHLRT